MEKGTPVGIPWYSPEEFVAVLAMLPAAERQSPISYDAFMAQVERGEQEFKSQGGIPIRVPVSAAAIKTWCEHNHSPVCRRAITAFVMFKAAEQFRDGRSNS